jgi:hypothetical protein
VRTCHSSVAASAAAARVAAPAAPIRNGVGSTGSAPPVNVTSTACLLSQPAIGRIVRSASFGVVMICNREPVNPSHCAWGRGAHPSLNNIQERYRLWPTPMTRTRVGHPAIEISPIFLTTSTARAAGSNWCHRRQGGEHSCTYTRRPWSYRLFGKSR